MQQKLLINNNNDNSHWQCHILLLHVIVFISCEGIFLSCLSLLIDNDNNNNNTVSHYLIVGGDKETSSVNIANAALNFCGHETMLHITCAEYSKDEARTHLTKAKNLGLKNILALRGGGCGLGRGLHILLFLF